MHIRSVAIACLLASPVLWAAEPPAPDAKAAKEKPIPSFLDCHKLSWVTNCKEIDKIARENPGAPLRLTNPDGLELYFVPGTPTAMIYHQLNPTPESARALIEYNRRYMAQMEKAAAVSLKVLGEMGGTDPVGSSGMRTSSVKPSSKGGPVTINAKNIRVWMFYDSKCSPCRQTIPEVYLLAKQNPSLDLTLLQMDDDLDYVDQLRTDMSLKAGPIPAKDRASLLPKIRQTPTFWVQDTRNKKTTVMEGYMSVTELSARLADLSK
ncbi:hypothetical protein E4T66_18355 [Sinimarinibacterium sp. CAU 1509]|uniref:conjugal transfer protein TraF n=1 Tax=Sinimarinibacterium sp. CAU 1509 TaxID=2562283 RepID=UPI0010ACBD97|nr:conjugal transfer protein TraF [Sinimarinibacterium sp. CAU 1509]TJY57369.1 hypothetical protein E4T66_18355 [Sinimarinibacterium sp. CAU 1509]